MLPTTRGLDVGTMAEKNLSYEELKEILRERNIEIEPCALITWDVKPKCVMVQVDGRIKIRGVTFEV